MSLILLGILTIVFVRIFNYWRLRSCMRLISKIPSNRLHTFFGWGKIFTSKDIIPLMYQNSQKYGPTCIVWLGPWPLFHSTDPQILKEILTSQNCTDKPWMGYDSLATVAGQGIITSSGPKWSLHRKLFNKAFSLKIILSFFPIFRREINTMIEHIGEGVDKGESVDMLRLFQEITLRNSTQTILKRNLELTEHKSTTLAGYLIDIFSYIGETTCNQILSLKWIRKLADIYMFQRPRESIYLFRKICKESLDILQQSGTNDPSYLPEVHSVLDFVLEGLQQNVIQKDEIESEMLHLFAASFETTASTLYFVLLLLAMHPQYQERAYEEIIDILPDDNDTDITVDQVNQLSYLEMIFFETMRVLPVVPIALRKVSNENLNLSNGLTLPVNQIIFLDIFSLHRSKNIWGPQADVFNPDNFLPANVEARHPFAFIPFTKGQRYCIGWKYATLFSKLCLAKIIKTYKFTTDSSYEDLIFHNHITLNLANNPRLRVERR